MLETGVASEGEAFLLSLVRSGYLSVDGSGCVWRHRTFSRTGREIALPAPKRADPVRPDGYATVKVAFGGREYFALAHRLVWLALVGAIPAGQEVNHKDGRRSANHPGNLDLLTKGGNLQHSYDVLNRPRRAGEKNGRAKLDRAQVVDIRRRATAGEPKRALARTFGVAPAMIRRIVDGTAWRDEFPA